VAPPLLLFADQKPTYSTSFRFASDDLWATVCQVQERA
jgi:hypothetical protein